MQRSRMLIGGMAIVAVLAAGGGVAYAEAGSTRPAQGVPPAPAAVQQHKARNLLGRIEHGEFTVRAKQRDVVLDVQRGKVTMVSPSSVTVNSVDGYTATYVVDTTTKVRKNKASATVGDVQTGDRVRVQADHNGMISTARRIVDAGAAPK